MKSLAAKIAGSVGEKEGAEDSEKMRLESAQELLAAVKGDDAQKLLRVIEGIVKALS